MVYSTATIPVNPQGVSTLKRTREMLAQGKLLEGAP
jgi:hypothetical protein